MNHDSAAEKEALVTLPNRPTIKVINELKDQCSQAIEHERIAIDAGQVELIDSAALQLLAAFANEAREKSRSLSWTSVSDSMRDATRLCGLTGVLGI